jgi:hypothetical protein
MNTDRLLNVTITTTLIVAFNLAALFTAEMLITSKTALAQIPPAPSFPDEGDSTTENQPEPIQSTTPTSIPTPTIQITSHEDGNQVPVGELTIQGTSSDNGESNCQVYTDVNDITPLQNATAAGANGAEDDYSRWTFTYTEDYQLITEGANELTAKISCFDDGGSATTTLSEWHSVNVTGVAGGGTTTPTMRQAPLTDDALEAEQGVNVIPAPATPPSPPVTTLEEPSGDSSQGQGGDDDDASGDDDDDDDGTSGATGTDDDDDDG